MHHGPDAWLGGGVLTQQLQSGGNAL